MLVCEQCGCSGELGMGWVTVVRAEADETGEHWMVEYCPSCAAAVLGRGSVARARDARASEREGLSQLPGERAAV